TVETTHLHSDLYVTLGDGDAYTATHGRHEFIETYPAWTRAVHAGLGAAMGLAGASLPVFVRHQYVYVGPDDRSHVLLLNLSNVTNRIQVTTSPDGTRRPARMLAISPHGAALLDVTSLAPAGARVLPLRLAGNAWFNLYLVGAGPRDLAGPLSLMHVK
ncbi:MAG TPA: hypothetical protein VLV15_06045, partial [Dongiaceae bacterium]|nr:hypothetical protein [Dongiaceae bacterium]